LNRYDVIARLNGIIIQKSIMNCLVDVNGTGYLVIVPLSTFYELPEIGSPVVLKTYMHVREDSISLYGFITEEEREAFQLMISISGIGPKLAINILSGITAGEWFQAVAGEDIKRLTVIPGVGRKTAERMILELKEKIVKLGRENYPSEKAVSETARMKEDALSALINLGYKGSAAKEAVEKVIRERKELLTIDEILKETLHVLSV
jgi:Holliday junction DNA helicase RuvA